MTTTTPAWFDRSQVAPASLIDEIELPLIVSGDDP